MDKTKDFLRLVFAKLSQKTSIAGILAAIAYFGVEIPVEWANAVTNFIVALSSLILVWIKPEAK